ncbi:MAG: hypothetical protein JO020_34860 [Chloroflexi bacterium]|nr:hypothetical protein [Chloroflexota bacterium]MBV9131192.1 hypothetical protein [Chloroflexota bacterium]MBV9899366.1 hypothetical protein [Chloroflexota bacterium]
MASVETGEPAAADGHLEQEATAPKPKPKNTDGILFLAAVFVAGVALYAAAAFLYFDGNVSFTDNGWNLVFFAAILSMLKTSITVAITRKYALHKHASEFCTLALGASFTATAAQINASSTNLFTNLPPILRDKSSTAPQWETLISMILISLLLSIATTKVSFELDRGDAAFWPVLYAFNVIVGLVLVVAYVALLVGKVG